MNTIIGKLLMDFIIIIIFFSNGREGRDPYSANGFYIIIGLYY